MILGLNTLHYQWLFGSRRTLAESLMLLMASGYALMLPGLLIHIVLTKRIKNPHWLALLYALLPILVLRPPVTFAAAWLIAFAFFVMASKRVLK
ncbi:hypothetical protein [Reinekea blandensis]|nr:hypothetical protein [Reinekea blandensis]